MFTQDTEYAIHGVHTEELEVPAGADVVERVTEYTRQGGRGVFILSGYGAIANVTLRQPEGSHPEINFTGRYHILSITGYIHPPPAPPGVNWLVVILVGEFGQLISGSVVGPLEVTMAAGPVVLMMIMLPLEDENEAASAAAAAGEVQHQGGGGGVGGAGDDDFPFYHLGRNFE